MEQWVRKWRPIEGVSPRNSSGTTKQERKNTELVFYGLLSVETRDCATIAVETNSSDEFGSSSEIFQLR